MRARLSATGADSELIGKITRLDELDGAIGNAILARATGMDELAATRAYVHLGEALGLDWARGAINRLSPVDGWERLLVAGLARDFEQLRLDFLGHMPAEDPVDKVDRWLNEHAADVAQFRARHMYKEIRSLADKMQDELYVLTREPKAFLDKTKNQEPLTEVILAGIFCLLMNIACVFSVLFYKRTR